MIQDIPVTELELERAAVEVMDRLVKLPDNITLPDNE
jgi:hypothetical protein